MHRDVKPANVLIAGDHVYLSDFGITRVQEADTQITDSGGWVGTVDFMSPEHLRGEPTDARSDVYALGCVLYTALAGRPPFRRQTVPATITAHLHEPPPRPSETPGVPLAFDAVVARALAKDPADRYAVGRRPRPRGARRRDRRARRHRARERRARARRRRSSAEPTRDHEPRRCRRGDRDRADLARGRRGGDARDDRRPVPRPARTGTGRATAGAAATARPTARVRTHRGRRRRLAGTLTWLVLLLPAAGVVASSRSATPGRPTGPLSTGEVTGIARTRSPTPTRTRTTVSLRRLLTPEARRVGTSDVQSGRAAVVGEYHRQFAPPTWSRYTLADMQVTGGRRRPRRGPLHGDPPRARPAHRAARARRRSAGAASRAST